MTITAPTRPPVVDAPGVDPEALIAEARRRQRRRRRGFALMALILVSASAGAYYGATTRTSHSSAAPGSAAAAKTRMLRFHLRGFGTPLATTIDSRPCPQGRTTMPIASDAGDRIGTEVLCVLTITKLDRPNWGVRRIVQTARVVDSLPGGTIVSRQKQTFLFARDQRQTRAIFRGRVVGGTGRYTHLRWTVSGGGPGREGKADWVLIFQVRQ
ncbi:MAG: hypothetical protein H0W90_08785 [Actinobacteria bacterium]|nr:hypothetical protein [Actinomycetota bacterium]